MLKGGDTAEPPPLTAEEAVRQAEAAGLTLLRSGSHSTGYKGVSFHCSCKNKPYQAKVWRGGKDVYLGCFETPEEAALSYARTPEALISSKSPPVRRVWLPRRLGRLRRQGPEPVSGADKPVRAPGGPGPPAGRLGTSEQYV